MRATNDGVDGDDDYWKINLPLKCVTIFGFLKITLFNQFVNRLKN